MAKDELLAGKNLQKSTQDYGFFLTLGLILGHYVGSNMQPGMDFNEELTGFIDLDGEDFP